MSIAIERRVAEALGREVQSIRPLSGGCVGEVYRARIADGRDVVIKVDEGQNSSLDIEGYMLRYLAEHSKLPVPGVVHCEAALLVMEFVEGVSSFSRGAEFHAAELLAELHGVTAPQFGLERDTLIGSLHQPNTPGDRWVHFFQEHRLLAMARQAYASEHMDARMLRRIEKFVANVDALLEEPPRPALLHGDVWSANVLAKGDRITGFVDPAIYFGHPEIELAFIALFGTFGEGFFSRYAELRGIAAGFFEVRRDVYNLYPLLVHVTLFGSSYLSGINRVLTRHGC